MGNYTTANINLTLKAETPPAVRGIILDLLDLGDYVGEARFNRPISGEEHEFFLCDRARHVLHDMNYAFSRLDWLSAEQVQARCKEDSEFAATVTDLDLEYGMDLGEVLERSSYDPESGRLEVRACIKAEDREFHKFLDWISRYLDYSKSDKVTTLQVETDCDIELVRVVIDPDLADQLSLA